MDAFLLALAILGLPEPDPPLTDLMWFPSYEACHKYRMFAAEHRDWLAFQADWHLSAQEEMAEWQIEAAWCWRVWDHLEDAGNPVMDKNWRRKYLGRLRHQIGREAYEAGRMPPPVPVWRFSPADR